MTAHVPRSEIRRAAELYEQGYTIRDIAAEMGLGYAQARLRVHRAGIQPEMGSPVNGDHALSRILFLRENSDLGWKKIGPMVGLSPNGARNVYLREMKRREEARREHAAA